MQTWARGDSLPRVRDAAVGDLMSDDSQAGGPGQTLFRVARAMSPSRALGDSAVAHRRFPGAPEGSRAAHGAQPRRSRAARRRPSAAEKRKRRSALAAFSGVLTFLLVAAVVAGVGLIMSSRGARLPGPLAADKVVVDSPEVRRRRGRADPRRRGRDRHKARLHRHLVHGRPARQAQGGRISVPAGRLVAGGHRHHRAGPRHFARGDHPRGTDQPAGGGQAARRRGARRRNPGDSARGRAAAGDLQVPARRHPRQTARQDGARAEGAGGRGLGAPHPRPAAALAL